ncbi:MAG: penicillin-binding transpeptidase domain-containing protein [Brevinema sp.]
MRYFLLITFLLSMACSKTKSILIEEEPWIESAFINYQQKENATFVLYDPQTDSTMVYNPKRSSVRFLPGSTFKLPNSVIALSEKIVTNVDQIFYEYNGEEVFLSEWSNNMGLKEAFKTSNVLAYQQIAKMIGLSKMNTYIKKFKYGNQNIGTIVNRFWLEGPLMISAVEQTEWLTKLLKNEFADTNIVTQIKEISYIETLTEDWKLYGKTGWAKDIGWFVGWIEKDDIFLPFALNIDISEYNLLPIRQSITKEILLNYIEKTQ